MDNKKYITPNQYIKADYSKPRKFLPILLVEKIPHPDAICK